MISLCFMDLVKSWKTKRCTTIRSITSKCRVQKNKNSTPAFFFFLLIVFELKFYVLASVGAKTDYSFYFQNEPNKISELSAKKKKFTFFLFSLRNIVESAQDNSLVWTCTDF